MVNISSADSGRYSAIVSPLLFYGCQCNKQREIIAARRQEIIWPWKFKKPIHTDGQICVVWGRKGTNISHQSTILI